MWTPGTPKKTRLYLGRADDIAREEKLTRGEILPPRTISCPKAVQEWDCFSWEEGQWREGRGLVRLIGYVGFKFEGTRKTQTCHWVWGRYWLTCARRERKQESCLIYQSFYQNLAHESVVQNVQKLQFWKSLPCSPMILNLDSHQCRSSWRLLQGGLELPV